MSQKAGAPAAVPYGCEASYRGPDVASLVRSDRRGQYRRPSIDLQTGAVKRNAAGDPLFDEAVFSTRYHMATVGKGYLLLAITESDRGEAVEVA